MFNLSKNLLLKLWVFFDLNLEIEKRLLVTHIYALLILIATHQKTSRCHIFLKGSQFDSSKYQYRWQWNGYWKVGSTSIDRLHEFIIFSYNQLFSIDSSERRFYSRRNFSSRFILEFLSCKTIRKFDFKWIFKTYSVLRRPLVNSIQYSDNEHDILCTQSCFSFFLRYYFILVM